MKHVTEADMAQLKSVVQQTLGIPDESKRLGCVVIVVGEMDDGGDAPSCKMFSMGLTDSGVVQAVGQAFFQACEGPDTSSKLNPTEHD